MKSYHTILHSQLSLKTHNYNIKSEKRISDKMPNDLVRPKGPYEINRLNRRRDTLEEEYYRRVNTRTHMPQPKMTLLRLLKLIVYFSMFYLVLATFTWFYMKFVFSIIEKENEPFQTKAPGLSSVPGEIVGNIKHIIWRPDLPSETGPIRKQMEGFVKPYGISGLRHLRACNLDNHWGYASKKPCILMKLNYSQNFTAITYNDGITLPDEAPMDLYNYLIEAAEEMRYNRIWLDCKFEEDQEDAYFDYIPYRYYDTDGLFLKEYAYLQFVSENLSEIEVIEDPAYRRVLGVQVFNLPPNKDIYFKCVVWAKNIPLSQGTVEFMLHSIEIEEEDDPDYSM